MNPFSGYADYILLTASFKNKLGLVFMEKFREKINRGFSHGQE